MLIVVDSHDDLAARAFEPQAEPARAAEQVDNKVVTRGVDDCAK